MKVMQLVDAGNLCVSGSSIDRTFFSLFPEFEDLVGNLVVKVLQEVNQHKLTIQLRLLKIINDTASLNNSSVVSNAYTPTIPHLESIAVCVEIRWTEIVMQQSTSAKRREGC